MCYRCLFVFLLCATYSHAAVEPVKMKVDHPITCIAVSKDGKMIVVGGPANPKKKGFSEPGKVTILDAGTGKVLRSFSTEKGVSAVAISPDGKRLLTGTSRGWRRTDASKKGSIFPQVWDLDSGKVALELDGHRGAVKGVAFFPDGKRMITASDDGSAIIFAADGQQLHVLRQTDRFIRTGVALSKDGKLAVVPGLTTKLTVWDTDNGQAVSTLNVGYNAFFATFGEGSQLAVCNRGTNDIAHRDAKTGQR